MPSLSHLKRLACRFCHLCDTTEVPTDCTGDHSACRSPPPPSGIPRASAAHAPGVGDFLVPATGGAAVPRIDTLVRYVESTNLYIAACKGGLIAAAPMKDETALRRGGGAAGRRGGRAAALFFFLLLPEREAPSLPRPR